MFLHGPKSCIDSDVAEAFRSEGVVSLGPLVSREGLCLLTAELDALAALAPTSNFTRVFDGRGELLIVRRAERQSDLLFDLARHEAVFGIAERLLGRPAVPLHVDFLVHPPGAPGTPPHQDHARYVSHFVEDAVSLCIALDEIHADSALLEFASPPGRKLLEHVPSWGPTAELELAASETPTSFGAVAAEAGECFAYDSYAIHRTQPNRTGATARVIVLTYRVSPYREWLGATRAW